MWQQNEASFCLHGPSSQPFSCTCGITRILWGRTVCSPSTCHTALSKQLHEPRFVPQPSSFPPLSIGSAIRPSHDWCIKGCRSSRTNLTGLSEPQTDSLLATPSRENLARDQVIAKGAPMAGESSSRVACACLPRATAASLKGNRTLTALAYTIHGSWDYWTLTTYNFKHVWAFIASFRWVSFHLLAVAGVVST